MKKPETLKLEDFLPLSQTNLYIMASLIQGPKHGYAILKQVEELSGGRVRLGIGNLYVALKRLLEQGLIERAGEREQGDGERRKVYRLNGLGEQVLQAETERLQRMLRALALGAAEQWVAP